MNAIAKAIPTTTELDELKIRLKATWMTGDYDVFSRYLEKDAELFFRRLGITPGTRLLDVGCGAGQLALIAARAGARVTGCDISTPWIEKARARAAAEGLEITFEEGDAESLPYEDAQFDAVVSLIGAMFAPRPDRVAAGAGNRGHRSTGCPGDCGGGWRGALFNPRARQPFPAAGVFTRIVYGEGWTGSAGRSLAFRLEGVRQQAGRGNETDQGVVRRDVMPTARAIE